MRESSVRIGHLPFAKQKKQFTRVQRLLDHNSKMAAKNWKRLAHFQLGCFGWKVWTTFQDAPLISQVFRSVEPKLSCHLQCHLNFRNFSVNGKQPT